MIVITLVMCGLFIVHVSGGDGHFKEQEKYIQPLDEAEYKILLLLVQGQFTKPVKERSVKEKSVIVKFWRAKGKYHCDRKDSSVLYYDGRKVIFCIKFLYKVP